MDRPLPFTFIHRVAQIAVSFNASCLVLSCHLFLSHVFRSQSTCGPPAPAFWFHSSRCANHPIIKSIVAVCYRYRPMYSDACLPASSCLSSPAGRCAACVTSCFWLMFQPAHVGTIVLVDHDILQKIDTETMTHIYSWCSPGPTRNNVIIIIQVYISYIFRNYSIG